MLDEFITTDVKEIKAFNVNMEKNQRTLHVNSDIIGPGKIEVRSTDGIVLPYKKCFYEKPYQFISFSSIADVEAFEKMHTCSFKRCGNCFPKSMRGN